MQCAGKIPKDYNALKTVADDCIKEIGLYKDTDKVFKTRKVRDALRAIMDSFIQVLDSISRYFSKHWTRASACKSDCNLVLYLI